MIEKDIDIDAEYSNTKGQSWNYYISTIARPSPSNVSNMTVIKRDPKQLDTNGQAWSMSTEMSKMRGKSTKYKVQRKCDKTYGWVMRRVVYVQ